MSKPSLLALAVAALTFTTTAAAPAHAGAIQEVSELLQKLITEELSAPAPAPHVELSDMTWPPMSNSWSVTLFLYQVQEHPEPGTWLPAVEAEALVDPTGVVQIELGGKALGEIDLSGVYGEDPEADAHDIAVGTCGMLFPGDPICFELGKFEGKYLLEPAKHLPSKSGEMGMYRVTPRLESWLSSSV